MKIHQSFAELGFSPKEMQICRRFARMMHEKQCAFFLGLQGPSMKILSSSNIASKKEIVEFLAEFVVHIRDEGNVEFKDSLDAN